MQIVTTTDAEQIVALLEPLLRADPVRHTVLGTVAVALRGEDAAGWCARPADGTGALAVRSQLHTPITVTAGWPALDPLADEIARLPQLSALGGPVDAVTDLAAALQARGRTPGRRIEERLFRLDELTPPLGVPGSARAATAADVDLLAEWFAAFALEAFGMVPPGFGTVAHVARAAQSLRPWIWSDESGAPRSMAVGRPPTYGVARLGPVYTPPEHRGSGFGSAVTAAATADVLAAGGVPVLYTDLANPTSNRIYRRLGYRAVEDRLHVQYE
jgi:GNAT superfamily N-acetyltransferase